MSLEYIEGTTAAFRLKSETDLFVLAKRKTHALSVALSQDGELMAILS